MKTISFRFNPLHIGLLILVFVLSDPFINCQNIKQPPKIGAFESGKFRNLFAECGYKETEINAKLESAWKQLFYGNDSTERIYYPVKPDMAYIFDVASNDVRSEGMSYGMMITLQMNKKKEFDALWKWTVTNMYNNDGDNKGYFAWHCKTDGSKIDVGPASDGEEWFVTTLFMASGRWGDGEGIYNYKSWAQKILNDMVHHPIAGLVTPMFDPKEKQIVFVPYGRYATFTDPSYHLPAFYTLWAKWADKDNQLFYEYADTSRKFFRKVIHPVSRLAPDYANFDASADTGFWRNNMHEHFFFDAWRTICNIAVDYAWFAADPWQMEQCDMLQSFFASQGVKKYPSLFSIDGNPISSDHSVGLVAMNATSSLAACNSTRAAMFVEDLWNAKIPSGHYRYYDGLLYFLGMLHVSGNYRIYAPR